MAQSSFLIFISEVFAFAGPVLLQQLLQSLEDRSSIGEDFCRDLDMHALQYMGEIASLGCSRPVVLLECTAAHSRPNRLR